ncbi:unnamed protein product, partial [Mesorhabditis spiculigera]
MADPVDNAPWYLQDPKDPGTVEPFMVAFRNLQENGRELEQYLQVEGRQFHSIDLCGFIKRASIESRRINHFLMTMSALPANERPPLPASLEELIHEFWDIDAIIGQGMEPAVTTHITVKDLQIQLLQMGIIPEFHFPSLTPLDGQFRLARQSVWKMYDSALERFGLNADITRTIGHYCDFFTLLAAKFDEAAAKDHHVLCETARLVLLRYGVPGLPGGPPL